MVVARPPVAVTYVASMVGKVRFGRPCTDEVQHRASALVEKHGLLGAAPFTWISIVITFGPCQSGPRLSGINQQYGDLPVSIAVPLTSVLQRPRDETCRAITRATVQCLLAAADRYGLGSTAFREDALALEVGAESGH
jgi:hypothetical protein